ncbi:MAG: hypothetical protein NZ529_03410 [Cytophagaceae bacterium]|nr:hypothetical protein [Cytophagaceae bacterium]MDW8455817.1 hypothetical protein [Cytophagaceae bacterium]
MNDDELLTYFREIFWHAFHVPKLTSPVFQDLFNKLEHINSILSGPLYSVYENGNCDYIFHDKKRFPFVNSTKDFYDWMQSLLDQYTEKILHTKSYNENMNADKNLLIYQTHVKNELIEIATYIQMTRMS